MGVKYDIVSTGAGGTEHVLPRAGVCFSYLKYQYGSELDQLQMSFKEIRMHFIRNLKRPEIKTIMLRVLEAFGMDEFVTFNEEGLAVVSDRRPKVVFKTLSMMRVFDVYQCDRLLVVERLEGMGFDTKVAFLLAHYLRIKKDATLDRSFDLSTCGEHGWIADARDMTIAGILGVALHAKDVLTKTDPCSTMSFSYIGVESLFRAFNGTGRKLHCILAEASVQSHDDWGPRYVKDKDLFPILYSVQEKYDEEVKRLKGVAGE